NCRRFCTHVRKVADGPRPAVFEEVEVVFREIRNLAAVAIDDDGVHLNQRYGNAQGWILCGKARRYKEQRKMTTVVQAFLPASHRLKGLGHLCVSEFQADAHGDDSGIYLRTRHSPKVGVADSANDTTEIRSV